MIEAADLRGGHTGVAREGRDVWMAPSVPRGTHSALGDHEAVLPGGPNVRKRSVTVSVGLSHPEEPRRS